MDTITAEARGSPSLAIYRSFLCVLGAPAVRYLVSDFRILQEISGWDNQCPTTGTIMGTQGENRCTSIRSFSITFTTPSWFAAGSGGCSGRPSFGPTSISAPWRSRGNSSGPTGWPRKGGDPPPLRRSLRYPSREDLDRRVAACGHHTDVLSQPPSERGHCFLPTARNAPGIQRNRWHGMEDRRRRDEEEVGSSDFHPQDPLFSLSGAGGFG